MSWCSVLWESSLLARGSKGSGNGSECLVFDAIAMQYRLSPRSSHLELMSTYGR